MAAADDERAIGRPIKLATTYVIYYLAQFFNFQLGFGIIHRGSHNEIATLMTGGPLGWFLPYHFLQLFSKILALSTASLGPLLQIASYTYFLR